MWFFTRLVRNAFLASLKSWLVPILGTQLSPNTRSKFYGGAKTTFGPSNLVLFGMIFIASPTPHPTCPAFRRPEIFVVPPLPAQLDRYFWARYLLHPGLLIQLERRFPKPHVLVPPLLAQCRITQNKIRTSRANPAIQFGTF